MSLPLLAAVTVGLAAVTLAVLLKRLSARSDSAVLNWVWLESFSVSKYRPMERLLSEQDIRFLRAQPGYRPGMARRLRAERRRIFRAYLKGLARDFGRLHQAARVLVLHAPRDRSDVAAALAWQRLVFLGALAAVHFRLLLHTFGLGPVDVRSLVDVLESTRLQVRELALPVAA